MRRPGVTAVPLLFLAGTLWAGPFWEKAEYTSWSQKECEQMLTKSPWAFQYAHTNLYRPATNITGGPGATTEGESKASSEPQTGERESRITFQFVLVSAKPIRMASAQLGLLESPQMKAQAEQFINQPVGNEILVQVQYASRPPGISAIHDIQNYFRRATINNFQINTFLTSSDRKLPVHASRYEQPNERNPFGLFAFTRLDEGGKSLFTGKEKSITLCCELRIPIAPSGGSENYPIFVKMEPKKMTFQNEFSM